MSRFVLPCSCGLKHEVSTAQAGERLTCSCGREIDVPTLRELQSLERVDEDKTAAAARPRWSARKGLIFLGLTLVVLAIGGRVWLYQTRPRELAVVQVFANDKSGVPHQLIVYLDDFDKLSPAEVFLTWRSTVPAGIARGLTKPGRDADEMKAHSVEIWQDWSYGDWGVGGLGVFLVALGLLIPQRKVRRRVKGRVAAAASAERLP